MLSSDTYQRGVNAHKEQVLDSAAQEENGGERLRKSDFEN